MSSFCTAKATHIFFSKKFQHICVSLNVNFNELLTNDIVSFEQLGPGKYFFFLFLSQKSILWLSLNCPLDAVSMTPGSICFHGEIKKT